MRYMICRSESEASGNPLLAKRMRRGGCAIKIEPHSFEGADGVVSLFSDPKGKPPRPRLQRMLRSVYLMPRPPLLIRFARRGLRSRGLPRNHRCECSIEASEVLEASLFDDSSLVENINPVGILNRA